MEQGFAIYNAPWLVDSWDGDRIKEKLAYCNSFHCAAAAYEAAVKAYPYEHITFRNGIRVVREHKGKWTPNAGKAGDVPEEGDSL